MKKILLGLAAACALAFSAAPAAAITLFSSTLGDVNFPGWAQAAPGNQPTIDGTPIGDTTPAAGHFTTISGTSTISGPVAATTLSAASLKFTGTIPVVTGTGTPTIAAGSTDNAGEVTAGASATSVVITFAGTHANAPFCTVTDQGPTLAAFAYTISTTAITVTQTANSANLIDYVCVQH